jgi:hypothetical protein
MYNLFYGSGYLYIATIVLQVICVIHCLRKGNQNYWIWLIVLLPLIGCIAYFFTEIFNKRDLHQVQSGVGDVFNPGGKIKKLENNLRFSDTFNNRVALADAYLAAGQLDRAIDLYESSLTGNFTENEYVLSNLIMAYFDKRNYEKIIPLAKKVQSRPQFARSKPHIRYAIALEHTGRPELAEAEFKTMKGKFANFEARYQYACFLARNNRKEESVQLLNEMINEQPHLSSVEKRNNNQWFNMARAEMKRLRSELV